MVTIGVTVVKTKSTIINDQRTSLTLVLYGKHDSSRSMIFRLLIRFKVHVFVIFRLYKHLIDTLLSIIKLLFDAVEHISSTYTSQCPCQTSTVKDDTTTTNHVQHDVHIRKFDGNFEYFLQDET
jgi:hypothetical protein